MDPITTLEVQVAIPLMTGLVAIGLAWVRKRLALQEEQTTSQQEMAANSAIQQAVENFAGRVAHGLAAGELTKQSAVKQLSGYLAETVPDSINLLEPTVQALETMLLGKVARLAGVGSIPKVEDATTIASR